MDVWVTTGMVNGEPKPIGVFHYKTVALTTAIIGRGDLRVETPEEEEAFKIIYKNGDSITIRHMQVE